jgi:hypothetical protein
VFAGSSIKSISIPGSVKVIPVKAFYNLSSLKDVTIAEGVTLIDA